MISFCREHAEHRAWAKRNNVNVNAIGEEA
jgi:hypothetical protein